MQIREGQEQEWQAWRDKTQDPYGGEVVRYAEAWADLMEKRIAAGAELEDVAKETSHEADTSGITGFMYGAAVSVLSGVWIHGDRLRRWHNKDWLGEKGADVEGVVNPAIVSIEVPGN